MKIFLSLILLFNFYTKALAQGPGDFPVFPGGGPPPSGGHEPGGGIDPIPPGLPTGPDGGIGGPGNPDDPFNPGSGGGDPWNPGDEGGDDPDNCYYCDGDSDTGGQEQANTDAARKLGFNLKPTISVDADGYTYIINLSDNAQVGNVELEKVPVSENGFKVIKMRRGGLSLGIEGDLSMAGYPGVSPHIGVTVSGGLAWVAERHVKTYPEIRKLPFISRVPSSPRLLEELAIGDSITFMVTGTIGIHAGITLGNVIKGGVEADVTGSWVTNVRKVGSQRVQVAYTRGRIRNVAITAGTIGAKASKKWYKELTETQAYEFDLAKPDGWKLYKRMLRGDVKTVKKQYLKELTVNRWTKFAKENKIKKSSEDLALAAGRKWRSKASQGRYQLSPRDRDLLNSFFRVMTVKMITIGTRQTQGSAFVKTVGVPIFFSYLWNTNDKSVVLERSREVADGLIGTNYYGVFKESKATAGIFTHHSNQIKLFMGGYQELLFLNPGDGPKKMFRMFGQVKYEYHREKWNEKKWDEKIRQAAGVIGFRKELTEIPRPYVKQAKFGQHTADLLLSQKTWANWMDWAQKNGPDGLVKIGTWKVEQWFKEKFDDDELDCRGLIRGLCKRKMIYQVEKEIPKALENLKAMAANMPTGEEPPKEFEKKVKGFSKIMADFGKSFIANHFILHSFLDLARQGDGDQFLVFQWQGSPIKRGHKVLIPSKYYKFRGHQICGLVGAQMKDRCDSPLTNRDPM